MIELGMIRDIVTIFGVIAGFTYYVLTVRNSQKMQKLTLETRQAQLFIEMFDKWHDFDRGTIEQEVLNWEWETLEDWNEKYGSDYMNVLKLGNSADFYEGLGILVHRGLLDPILVDDLISGNLITYWEETEPLWIAVRERYNYPQVAQWVEYLYNEVKQIMLDEHPELANKVVGLRGH